jgi:hypothetical protein
VTLAGRQFKDVDDRLLDLAGSLAKTVVPLDTLLQVI